ncbi:hypothetical protein F8388_014255 [Cannabis sativa]|uniref:Zinc knuckle CX2CX4HX4C domain-containing protein n=1 Tax=Cannabis sativa TaxID=3483 RepID=A0A7J6GQC4_CANSA|nr:hypothetical protein F8388_014255 [Cannabis sativa]
MSSSLSLQSPSSSPFISVNIRPWSPPFNDGRLGSSTIFHPPTLASNAVSRRNQAFIPFVFSFTNDLSSLTENLRDPVGATVEFAEIIIRMSNMENLSISRHHLNMEDLSNTSNVALNLTEFETQIHSFSDIPEHPEEDNREEPSAFLAVKLLTTRHFNSEAFKKRLRQMWPEHFSINVLEKEPNFFTVEFGCFGDHQRVLVVDTTSLKETWGPYLRVRIELDVTQPLPRGTGFHFHGMAVPVWLAFRFENVPDFCHYCGRLSHIVNHCHEFLAKCDSSSAPPLLRYVHSLGAKI